MGGAYDGPTLKAQTFLIPEVLGSQQVLTFNPRGMIFTKTAILGGHWLGPWQLISKPALPGPDVCLEDEKGATSDDP